MKQRLLGAAVLIALAIIFVPMLLTGPGTKKTSETANLQAPPTPDRRFQERTLSLDLPPAGAAPASTAEPVDPNRIATVDTATAPPSEAVEVTDEVADSAAAEPAPEPSTTTTTPASPTTAAEDLPGTAANGSYFVHLGDYGNDKNANDLVAALKKSGYVAFTESSTFRGKQTLRVRVGPFADRAAAEATRLRISQTSLRAPASVVQNASDAKASSPTADADAASAKAGGWAVQLGAFATVGEADRLRDKATAARFPAFVDEVTRDGKSLWRVRIGPQASRGNADAELARVKDRLKIDGVVVPNP